MLPQTKEAMHAMPNKMKRIRAALKDDKLPGPELKGQIKECQERVKARAEGSTE